MQWLDRLERHFGQWSIPQFPLFIAAANGVIYLLAQMDPRFTTQLVLIPDAVRAGQWWRIVTFLFIPPMLGPIWMVFWLYLLYTYAQVLEHEWGEFKFCFYYVIGALATIIAALFIVNESLSNVPLNTTLFLAFATLYPDFELLLFFIIPVKVKYMAWFIWLALAWSFVTGSFVTRVGIGASLFNYSLFFGPDLWQELRLKVEVYRNRRRFKP